MPASVYASINALNKSVNYPSWMMSIWRLILWHTFRVVHTILCTVVSSMGGALKHVWPNAVYFRWLVLACVGMRKVEAGEIVKAKRFGDELLHLSEKYKDDWNYGNAIHKGNLILGRVALRQGNIKAAKQYLIHAGETPGSPQLDSFGPNMSLAKELLEAGEKEAVLDYFRKCANFWEMDFGKLKNWAEIIQSGRTPKFGPHLLY